MKFTRLFKIEMQRIISRPIYTVMVFLVVFFYFSGSYGDIQTLIVSPFADILYVHFYVRQFPYSTVFIIMCAVASSGSFIEDVDKKYYNFVIARSGKDLYIMAKFLAVVIAGGLVLALGELLYILLLCLKFPLVAENSAMVENAMNSTSSYLLELLRNGQYIAYFAVYILLSFLFGALWSAVGLAISSYIPNKFIAAFSPYIVFQINDIFIHDWHGRTIVMFRGNYALRTFEESMIYAIGFFALLIFLCGILFKIGIMRRIKN